MIFRGLTPANDWAFGQGIASYVTGSAAVALNVKTALLTFYGDAFWAATFGVDWLNLLGNRNTQNAILAQTRAVIAGAEGVTKILSVSANFNRGSRTLFLQYRYADVYSPSVSGSVPIGV